MGRVGSGVYVDYKVCKKEITDGLANNEPIFERTDKIIPIKRLDGAKDVSERHRVNVRVSEIYSQDGILPNKI